MGAKLDKAKGRTKEAVGDLTGNKKMKTEGVIDRKAGEVKDKVGGAVDATKRKAREITR